MRNLWIIVKREFITRVQTKGFVIATILTPLLLGMVMAVPSFLLRMDVEKKYTILVSDPGDIIYNELATFLDDTLQTGEKKFVLTRDDEASGESPELKQALEEGNLEGFIYLKPTLIDSGEIVYYSKNVSNFDVVRPLQQVVNSIIRDKHVKAYNLDDEIVASLTRWIGMQTIKIRKGEAKESGFIQEFFVSYVFVLILYVTILIYGQSSGRAVLEDKKNRVVEVLLSSATAKQMMGGKLLGVGAVGIFQYIIWTIAGVGLFMFSIPYLPPEVLSAINIDLSVLAYFVMFFALGYFLYSAIVLGLASMVNSDEEFQQLFMPVILLIVMPLLIMGFIVKDPNSTVAVWTSLVPFFSPMLMMLRVTIANPPVWQIVGSIGILVLSIWFFIWLAAKIFRTGILMYGKRPNLPELIKWMKYK